MPHTPNIFAGIPGELPEELFEALLAGNNIKIERIVSHGHASPEGFWYDQDQHEWVILLRGAARLRLEGYEKAIEMIPGSFIDLPAHKRHRVEWTDPAQHTIWWRCIMETGSERRGPVRWPWCEYVMQQDVELFFKLHRALLFFVNQRLQLGVIVNHADRVHL